MTGPAAGPDIFTASLADTAAETSLYSYRCDACGDAATWRPSKQQVMCRSCGTVVPLAAADAAPAASFFLVPFLRDSPENRREFKPTRVESPCPTCNHVVVFEAAIEGTICAACLTPLLRPPNANDMPIRPTGVVPFRIDEADARERLRTWWRGLRGSDPRTRRLTPGPLVPRYVPYFQFSVHVHCPWRHLSTDSEGREVATDGEVVGDYGEREPGNHNLPDNLLQSLPFAFADAVTFDRRYLAGAVVEQYDADLYQAWDPARKRLEGLIDRLVAKDSKTFAGPSERWPSWSEEKGWLILAPFYTTTIDFRGKSHHIVIDGHGGQIASSVPQFVSLGTWLVALGVLAAVIALIWWAISLLISWLP
jgi:ribosomal protein S27E